MKLCAASSDSGVTVGDAGSRRKSVVNRGPGYAGAARCVGLAAKEI